MFKLFGKKKREMEELKRNVILRDILINSKFRGNVKDPKLLNELNSEKFNGYSFGEVKEQISDFNFQNIDELVEVLDRLEYKQYILDEYRPLVIEKKITKKSVVKKTQSTDNKEKEGK